ncbi:MAG: hypothetical protein M0T73_15245 [Deltaproteobacteria bacterium]|nr:hypothetical protein [Deltaproteobacteria bacterium]
MRTGRYLLLVGVFLVAALFTNFGLFIAPAISHETPEQERTDCIQECQLRFWPVGNLWLAYARCLDNCEKKFWKKWQKGMDKLEKE